MGERKVLKIDSVADRGVALGRMDGKAVFVDMAAPGDLCEVEITSDKPGFATARLVKVLEPSPNRVSPLCPHFSTCGGCSWQHLAHEEEIRGKAQSLKGFFASRLDLDPSVFSPPIHSKNPYGYRNRITLTVGRTTGRGQLCLSGKRSHQLVQISFCAVAAPELNNLLYDLNSQGALLDSLPAGSKLLLQLDDADGLWLLLSPPGSISGGVKRALAAWASSAGLLGAWVREGKDLNPLPGFTREDMTFFAPCGERLLPMGVGVGSFVQANQSVSRALVDFAFRAAQPLGPEADFLDLYCGSGNFTLSLASLGRSVLGVEGDPRSSEWARRNLKANGFLNSRIITSPVEDFCGGEVPKAGLWVLDPPRAGAPECARLAATPLGPQTIVYISCAPPTLLRDMKTLAAAGYTVQKIAAADMFPRTGHLEVAALLSRNL